MAAPPVVQTESMMRIIQINDDENSGREADSSLRVATPLLKKKPEAFIPQFLSIGPYHHSKLKKDIESSCAETRKISTAETYKRMNAVRLSQKLGENGKNFESIVEMIHQMWPEIVYFYHWSPITYAENSQNFALRMAVDSFFLLQFLVRLGKFSDHTPAPASASSSSSQSPSSDDYMTKLNPLHVCIKCDILKLENQIPLAVARRVFDIIKETLGLKDFSFEVFLQKISKELCPVGERDSNDKNEAMEACLSCLDTLGLKKKATNLKEALPCLKKAAAKEAAAKDAAHEPHLLGCLHKFVSPFVEIAPDEGTQSKWKILLRILKVTLELPFLLIGLVVYYFIPYSSFELPYEIALNARKLAKGGIEFKPHTKIQFDKYSDTLYLPRINVWEIYTEVFLRNMVALEFNDTTRGNTVMRYVSLMDCLIQTPEDARVLRHCGVIDSYTLTDEEIARMWNDLAQPFFTGYMGPHSDQFAKDLFSALQKNDRLSKIKRMLWGFFDLLSNWKFIAAVAALLVFAMTVIQTYCNLYQLHQSPASQPPPPHA